MMKFEKLKMYLKILNFEKPLQCSWGGWIPRIAGYLKQKSINLTRTLERINDEDIFEYV